MAALNSPMHRAVHPHRHHVAHHLARWQRLGVYAVGMLLLASGCAWLALHYLIGAGAGELPHPLEAWSMRVHGLAAFAGLFMLGAVSAGHVPQGWHLSRRLRWAHQRSTGLVLCALAAALALSGYGLYYFAPETVRPTLGWLHTAAGVGLVAAIALHRRGFGQAPS